MDFDYDTNLMNVHSDEDAKFEQDVIKCILTP